MIKYSPDRFKQRHQRVTIVAYLGIKTKIINYYKINQRPIVSFVLLFFWFFLMTSNQSFAQKLGSESNVSDNTKVTKPKSKLAPLPEPLTLKQALQIAEQSFPQLDAIKAERQILNAQAASIDAKYGVRTQFEGKLRWIDPAETAQNTESDDSSAALLLRKRLYDFGYRSASKRSLQALLNSKNLAIVDARKRRRIEVMQAYFAVLLADMKYAYLNEAMAVAYVSYDRIKNRQKVGQLSDLEVLKAETAYQTSRSKRYRADVDRRIARERLANLLNRPGQLSAKLRYPALLVLQRPLPELDSLIALALKNNRSIKILESNLYAKKQAMLAAKKSFGPVLEFEAGAYEYQRPIGSRDKLRAGITFKLPLTTGGARQAAVAKAAAEYQQVLAQVKQKKQDVRLAVVELSQALYVIKAKIDQMKSLNQYRNLLLDQSRALYQMDVRADLGDGMVNQSKAKYLKAQAEFDMALTWANLDAVVNQVQSNSKAQAKANSLQTKTNKPLDSKLPEARPASQSDN